MNERVGTSVALLSCIAFAGCASVPTPPRREDPKRAVAPTGKLRVGFLSVPIYATKDPTSGELSGVAVDLGRELARRIGVPFEPVPYSTLPAVLAGAQSEWDVVLMGIDAEREQVVDFTAPYMVVEFGYLVSGSSSIAASSDVDRPGVIVAVLDKSSPDRHLSRSLRNASLVRTSTPAAMADALKAGTVHAIAAAKPTLIGMTAKDPGWRVLEDSFMDEPIGMGVPKDRPLAASYVRAFVESAKSDGLVKAAVERAGLRGVVVAPRAPHK